MHKFEIPYNFDIKLIEILKLFDPEGETVDCIYIPPFQKDYQTILRTADQADFLENMNRQDYEYHINFINRLFPNKLQLLLQKDTLMLSQEKIKYYINLGFKNFCVASLEQAKAIREINDNVKIVGSITMKINLQKLTKNNEEYQKYFNSFVLPFSFCKDLKEIKKLPKNFDYILLVNAYCNTSCNGTHHWLASYKNEVIKCPGILDKNNLKWKNTTRIRPMDLFLFAPYIKVFKLQDRGWPTEEILRDYILYTSNYTIYPEINYTEKIYINE